MYRYHQPVQPMSSVDEPLLLELSDDGQSVNSVQDQVSSPVSKDSPLPSGQLLSSWKPNEYAVYYYSPNQESIDKQNDVTTVGVGFSLSLIGSSVAPDREHFLRACVGSRLSPLYLDSGQIIALEPPEAFPSPSLCYYTLVDLHQEDGTDINKFILCFLLIGKQGLELFRSELDSFSTHLKPLLKQLLPYETAEVRFPGSQLQLQLNDWFATNVEYLARVVQTYHVRLPSLLHTAVNVGVQVVGENSLKVQDIKQFIESCSLASVLHFDKVKKDVDLLLLHDDTQVETDKEKPLSICVSESDCTLSPDVSSQFCSNWAQVLLSQGTSNPDPFFIRQALENYKLKVVQDMNAFRRLVRQAETNYHAIYRCYLFLSNCGNGKLLLDCAVKEAETIDLNSEALAVLRALQMYIDKVGFNSSKA